MGAVYVKWMRGGHFQIMDLQMTHKFSIYHSTDIFMGESPHPRTVNHIALVKAKKMSLTHDFPPGELKRGRGEPDWWILAATEPFPRQWTTKSKLWNNFEKHLWNLAKEKPENLNLDTSFCLRLCENLNFEEISQYGGGWQVTRINYSYFYNYN